jgi:hypothetical protein
MKMVKPLNSNSLVHKLITTKSKWIENFNPLGFKWRIESLIQSL